MQHLKVACLQIVYALAIKLPKGLDPRTAHMRVMIFPSCVVRFCGQLTRTRSPVVPPWFAIFTKLFFRLVVVVTLGLTVALGLEIWHLRMGRRSYIVYSWSFSLSSGTFF